MTQSPGGHREAASSPEVADLVAAAARSVPGVTDLHPGAFGEVATYLPGRRVTGVRLVDAATEVHVVVTLQAPIPTTAEAVRCAVRPLVDNEVHVYVEDIDQSSLLS